MEPTCFRRSAAHRSCPGCRLRHRRAAPARPGRDRARRYPFQVGPPQHHQNPRPCGVSYRCRPIGQQSIVLRRPLESTRYTSIEFGRRCRDAGVRPSMGSVGDAYDNAMCESFFATLECDERQIAPSATGGQTNLPLSSHFVARTMPLPSHASSLIRSFRFERNTNISPPYGSAQSACATSATSPCTPRRKSIGCVATHTRSPARVAIKPGRPAPPPAPATTSPRRHPSPPVCLRHPARSRSRRPPVGDQPAHRTAVLPRRPSPAQK